MSLSTNDVCQLTAREMAALLQRRELSAREVVDAHLDRVELVNPQVNAVVTVTAERARDEARAADERVASGAPTGPLHGLPMAHKDTHRTAGIRTTYGSLTMRDHVPDEDELVIARLRSAGAITIGKTNAPEFGAGSQTFNEIFGATRNPYDLSRTVGGSSGGAAAALVTGMHPLADGSDMGGSLRNPASFCNVAGLRPSPGRVPSYPNEAAWSTMSVQGPMARTVGDLALLLSVMAGPDARSPISLEQPGSDFAPPLDGDVEGLRVGWTPDLGGSVPVESAVTETLSRQLGVFEDLGCVVDEACPDFAGADEVFRTLRAWQFHLMLGGLSDERRELLKPTLRRNIDEGARLTGPDLARAERLHTELFHRMRRFFDEYDILLMPVTQVVPFDVDVEYPTEIDGVTLPTYLDWMRSAYLVSSTGHPALSVPAGFTEEGLPVGLQVVGRHRADLDVLRVGHAFEEATQFWRTAPPLP